MYNKKLNSYCLHIIYCVLYCLFFLFGNTTQAKDTTLIIPLTSSQKPTDPEYYYEEVLKLALRKTEIIGDKTILKYFPVTAGRERMSAILKAGTGLDIIWRSYDRQREENLLAIKFNLTQDIGDYKILLIRKEDQEKFSKINKLSDLRNFKAGTGTHWLDTQFLKKNDIPFVTSWSYEPIFKMLAAKRFDYIIRGSQEIWNEIDDHKNFNFAAEETLLIHYNIPVYFFVNPKNTELADRISRGLTLAKSDGSLDKLFFSIPGYKRGYDEIHSKKRKLLNLENVE